MPHPPEADGEQEAATCARERPLVVALAECRRLLRLVSDGVFPTDAAVVARYGLPDTSFMKEKSSLASLHMVRTNHTLRHLNQTMMEECAPASSTTVERHPSNPMSQKMRVYVGLELVVRRTNKVVGLYNKAHFDVIGVDPIAKGGVCRSSA